MRKRYRGWFLMINFLLGVTRLEDSAFFFDEPRQIPILCKDTERIGGAHRAGSLLVLVNSTAFCNAHDSLYIKSLHCHFLKSQVTSSHCIPFFTRELPLSNTISRLDVDPLGLWFAFPPIRSWMLPSISVSTRQCWVSRCPAASHASWRGRITDSWLNGA